MKVELKSSPISKEEIEELLSQKWERYGTYLVSPCGKYQVSILRASLEFISREALDLRMLNIHSTF